MILLALGHKMVNAETRFEPNSLDTAHSFNRFYRIWAKMLLYEEKQSRGGCGREKWLQWEKDECKGWHQGKMNRCLMQVIYEQVISIEDVLKWKYIYMYVCI